MADAGVAISWAAPVRGREQQGLGVFAEVNAYYEKAKANGDIEDFEVLLFEAGGPIAGSFYLFGSEDQIEAITRSDEFGRTVIKGQYVVDDIAVTRFSCGEGLMRQMGMYGETVADLSS